MSLATAATAWLIADGGFGVRHPATAVRRFVACAMAAILAACGLPGFEPPGVMPEPGRDDTAPIGRVVELGRGEAHGVAWRYTVWESQMGACWSIEFPDGGSSTCGGGFGSGAAPLVISSQSSGTGMPFVIEGFVGGEVASVAVVLADGARLPATLLSLERIGAAGRAFVAVIPSNRHPVGVVALDAGGAELASEPIQLR